MKIVFPEYIDLDRQQIQELKALGDVAIYDDTPESETDVIKRISGAKVITSCWHGITANIIQNSPSLKFIVVPAVGYEHIDVKAASHAGITVSNCPTHNTRAVAEHTIALMFLVARGIIEANAAIKNGQWKPAKYTGIELKGKKLGLIGYGNIGKTVAQLAKDIGMDVSYANSSTSSVELDALIANSNIVSLHVPITDTTRHLLNERMLRLMKKDAYLINTSRGAVIDQNALIKTLKTGHLAGVALDVFENEPLTDRLPEGLLELVNCRNVVATPHIGFNTHEAAYRLGEELIANIKAIINGCPINIVSQ